MRDRIAFVRLFISLVIMFLFIAKAAFGAEKQPPIVISKQVPVCNLVDGKLVAEKGYENFQACAESLLQSAIQCNDKLQSLMTPKPTEKKK